MQTVSEGRTITVCLHKWGWIKFDVLKIVLVVHERIVNAEGL